MPLSRDGFRQCGESLTSAFVYGVIVIDESHPRAPRCMRNFLSTLEQRSLLPQLELFLRPKRPGRKKIDILKSRRHETADCGQA